MWELLDALPKRPSYHALDFIRGHLKVHDAAPSAGIVRCEIHATEKIEKIFHKNQR